MRHRPGGRAGCARSAASPDTSARSTRPPRVPPTDLLPRLASGSNRAEPYLYSDAEVSALLAAARSIRSPLTAATCETLIGLLAVTGIRVGEALHLDRGDLDRVRGVLIVRDSKFDRSREVALHESTLAALDRYGRLRDVQHPTPLSSSLFISRTGGRLSYRTMNWHFGRLVRKAGLAPRPGRCRPRMQDYADLRIMPILPVDPLRGRGFVLLRSA